MVQHWRRKWQPTPVFLPGESQGWGSLVGCCLWGRTESDTTEVTEHQQQQHGTDSELDNLSVTSNYLYHLLCDFVQVDLTMLNLNFLVCKTELIPVPPHMTVLKFNSEN